jgi:F-type H+-transporting ATPase subunit gamma
MEQLYDIKKRIRSVDQIGQLTRAMELVSAAKMRKSKAQLARVLPFFSLCAESMLEIQRSTNDIDGRSDTLF